MNKLFSILVIIALVVIGFGNVDANSTTCLNSKLENKILDQEQIDYSGGSVCIDNNQLLIQSFQPALEWITKIEVYLSKCNQSLISTNLILSLRGEIKGFDLISVTIPSDIIQTEGCWVTCNIPKTKVTDHQTYYLICKSMTPSYNTGIHWYYNNKKSDTDAYLCGTGIISTIINQTYSQSFDFAFKTYGTGDGEVERWAISMGAGFDSCRNDAIQLQNILHNNTPEVWPLDHFKIYNTEKTARWANILEGLRWIESREDGNDITIWQSACHGWLTGLHDDYTMLDYQYLNKEFDNFDGTLVVMICACYSFVAHDFLAKEGRIIMTGRSESLPNMTFSPILKNTLSKHSSELINSTFFFQYFLHPECGGAWGNDCCDVDYGNQDSWISAEEAFAFVLDIGDWLLVNLSGYLYPSITDLVEGDVPITSLARSPPQTPRRPAGNLKGIPGIKYEFRSYTYDPDEDPVYYLFDWGDGTQTEWLGPYDSGSIVVANHRWMSKGNYKIKVKAKDEFDGESDWSEDLTISMPKAQNKNNLIITKYRFFNKFIKELLL